MQAYAPPNMVSQKDTLIYGGIWLMFAVSGIVFIEPTPFDLILIVMAGVLFLSGTLRIPSVLALPIFLLFLMVIFGLVSAAISDYWQESIMHIIITLFLVFMTIFIACAVYYNPERILQAIFGGYAIAAMIAVFAGIVGYFSLTDGAFDLFTLYGRARGTFKDPNVYGPFLIPPALYAFFQLARNINKYSLFWLPVFGFCIIGILLSFSRGAWGHTLFSFLLGFGLLFGTGDRALKRRLTIALIVCGVLGIAAIAIMITTTSVGTLLTERFQLVQSYDLNAGGGRFHGQAFALKQIAENPLGIGALAFDKIWPENPHNVYLFVPLGSGWIGGFAYILLVISTLGCGLFCCLRKSPVQVTAIVLYASLQGLVLEGLVIDTDHWRHFYFLTAMIWGITAYVLDLQRQQSHTQVFAQAPNLQPQYYFNPGTHPN